MLFSHLAGMLLLGLAESILVASHPGPFSVAMKVKALTDQGRVDPFNATTKRMVLLSLFWPILSTANFSEDTIPYMAPATAASYGPLAESAGLPGTLFGSFQLSFCNPSQQATGCRPGKGKVPRFPLVLFSPGLGESRLLYSVTAQSIAAQGYVVATVDHPYDAEAVEFPDGSVVRRNWTAGMEQRLTEIRAADITFTLSQLSHGTTTTSGALFPYDQGLLPAQIDSARVIAMGHSVGGAAAFHAVRQDQRIRGGIDLDGRLNRPLLLLGRGGGGDADARGQGDVDSSFTDLPVLIEALGLPEEARARVEAMLGVVRGARMQRILVELSSPFSTWAFGGGYRRLVEVAGGLEEVL
ncbi:uncharacterized protein B0T15DRAFT_510912 [Chaetomium strumarium]|uniref:1-alkyl-2-acetylglycerophosphocholine esterase n=1 Tax=Chaetomium strumarium TaxID=1170767 RepID=A0AAJ0GWW9_9PEZI|nr:hypothetical protein B0T15DRAFT_510912 [Chaetomium strumarium]